MRYDAAEPQSRLPDLTACDREPIHIPGTIQPHGFLFSLTAALRVDVVSANVAEHLGQKPAALLGLSVGELLDPASAAIVTEVLLQQEASTGLSDVRICGTAQPWEAFLQSCGSGALLEVKLPKMLLSHSIRSILAGYDNATRRMRKASDVPGICNCLAEEVQRLTGYDRVKVYRFTAEWNGEVIAEANSGLLPSYLGLFFPASDIPVQARALYTINLERQIPDISYTPVPLISATADPLDLSHALLRSVSPVHLEYLRNMEVGASMSVSILRDGRLWGLIACHHHEARYVIPELRQAAVLLAHLAAWQLTVAEEADIMRRLVGVRAIEAALLQDATSGTHFRDAMLMHGDSLLDLMQASGFVFSQGPGVTLFGDTPPEADLNRLIDHLIDNQSGIFATANLSSFYPLATAWPQAAGMIAVALGGLSRDMMIWFRPAIAQTVTWGGAPAKPGGVALQDAETGMRLSPRKSFAAWTETVTGQARPWAPHELAAANGLRDVIVDLALRRTAELEQMNSELLRSNEELEAFAYVASHDLKEPLRQIETFGTLLERVFGTRDLKTPEVKRWFDGIQTSSRRLRALIGDLAEYSRLGHQANPFTPVSLDELITNVRTDLETLIKSNDVNLSVGQQPVLMCDRSQMQQVIQNIIENAIKYRHVDRPPVIRVSSVILPPGNAMADLPVLELTIEDNGIGIAERHREQIFEPFQRLHSSDEYDGSGIGLAICRKIVERHRGTISVSNGIGKGSAFKIRLPMRPPFGPGNHP